MIVSRLKNVCRNAAPKFSCFWIQLLFHAIKVKFWEKCLHVLRDGIFSKDTLYSGNFLLYKFKEKLWMTLEFSLFPQTPFLKPWKSNLMSFLRNYMVKSSPSSEIYISMCYLGNYVDISIWIMMVPLKLGILLCQFLTPARRKVHH